jgi:hypothetical protein
VDNCNLGTCVYNTLVLLIIGLLYLWIFSFFTCITLLLTFYIINVISDQCTDIPRRDEDQGTDVPRQDEDQGTDLPTCMIIIDNFK